MFNRPIKGSFVRLCCRLILRLRKASRVESVFVPVFAQRALIIRDHRQPLGLGRNQLPTLLLSLARSLAM